MRTCCIYPVGMPSSAPPAPTPAPTASPPRQPAADRVYAHVKQGVLERRYEGGVLLTEANSPRPWGLADPVREALLRLEAEG